MKDSKIILTKKIKKVINKFVSGQPRLFTTTFSIYLAKKVNYDYTYMSNIFSKTEGKTVEKYLIDAKINRVKKLIQNGELTLSEIAVIQHYKSLPHLCSQFKKTTGKKLSDFRKNHLAKSTAK